MQKRIRSIPEKKKSGSSSSKGPSFPVVGIGGSAGGLEAFRALLSSLSNKPGMAFVFIMHLAPGHKSMLAELLAGFTKMPVREVRSNIPLEVNHVYVMPANSHIFITHRKLKLQDLKDTGLRMPIDGFFRSLAEEQGDRAVGVILSGTATDGTLGAEAIKAAGGIALAQDERSAQYDGMPHSAIAAGCVDFVGSPKAIAAELERIAKHPLLAHSGSTQEEEIIMEGKGIESILGTLRAVKGLDFTHYKIATIRRRISRRMILLKQDGLKAYAKFLNNNKNEIENLYEDLLINVTSFFRDPKAFHALKTKVLPAILKDKTREQGVRIWVPGCASGEEAYSIAMCLAEVLGNRANTVPVQIFATDVSERSIQKAREGLYGHNIKADLTSGQLKRFFTKAGESYQISKQLREMCVFSKHNMLSDPPFSRLDLISCRNMLIYLQPVLQKKAFYNFHYALSLGGFLLLGNSESVSGYASLFKVLDHKQKIFVKKYLYVMPELGIGLRSRPYLPAESGFGEKVQFTSDKETDIASIVDKAVLAEYASCGVLIDGNMDVVQFRGHTGRYLESASGKPSLNLFKLAREGLQIPLRAAILKAKKTRRTVKSETENARHNNQRIRVSITVIPVSPPVAGSRPKAIRAGTSEEELFLVLFAEGGEGDFSQKSLRIRGKKSSQGKSSESDGSAHDLQKELMETKAYLQTVMEDQESANEELKTANEEILSSNEELQSTNEELETSKEELQSANEELTTANDELQSRNAQVSLLNNDLINLLGSINMPILMLGMDLVIRRITPQAEKVLNVIPSDVGRPIHKIRLNVDIPNLEKILSDVMESLHPQEFEIQDKEEHWFSVHVRPYRTEDHKIDGVVMIFRDITERKKADEVLAKLAVTKSKFVSTVSHELRSPLTVVKQSLDIVLDGLAGKINAQQKDILSVAKRNADRLARLTHNILNFQKIEAGKIGTDCQENDLNEIVEEVFKSLRLFSKKRGLILKLETDDSLPKMKFDKDQIIQVLTNLMNNAIRNTPCGSITLSIQKENDAAHIRVRDTGKGISAEDLRRLFTPFERVERLNEQEKGGTGLGLAISKELVLAHHGKIWMESELGSGTTVHFTLPL